MSSIVEEQFMDREEALRQRLLRFREGDSVRPPIRINDEFQDRWKSRAMRKDDGWHEFVCCAGTWWGREVTQDRIQISEAVWGLQYINYLTTRIDNPDEIDVRISDEMKWRIAQRIVRKFERVMERLDARVKDDWSIGIRFHTCFELWETIHQPEYIPQDGQGGWATQIAKAIFAPYYDPKIAGQGRA